MKAQERENENRGVLLFYRLGGGEGDAEEVKSHVFFETINWDNVYNKMIYPPFVPIVHSQTSTDYFDKKFTDQDPQLSPPGESMSSSAFLPPLIFSFPFSSGSLKDYGELFKDFDSV